jgi:hypothetical protein
LRAAFPAAELFTSMFTGALARGAHGGADDGSTLARSPKR